MIEDLAEWRQSKLSSNLCALILPRKRFTSYNLPAFVFVIDNMLRLYELTSWCGLPSSWILLHLIASFMATTSSYGGPRSDFKSVSSFRCAMWHVHHWIFIHYWCRDPWSVLARIFNKVTNSNLHKSDDEEKNPKDLKEPYNLHLVFVMLCRMPRRMWINCRMTGRMW